MANAYREAAKLALENGTIIEQTIRNHYKIIYNYDQTAFVEKMMYDFETELKNQRFDASCQASVSIKDENKSDFEGIYR